MQIGGLQKLSLIDYPDKLACVVFCAGCSYRCPWCHNPELVLPEKINKIPKISEQDFFEFLKQRKGLLDGVCIGGGEPTINQDLQEFCQKIKELDYAIKLDTNGSNPEILEKLINNKLIDYVALDVKAPAEKYVQLIGLEKNIGLGRAQNFWTDKIIQNVDKSIQLLKQNKIDYEFRTTVVPEILKIEDIIKIAQWIEPAKRYFLQQFRPQKTLNTEFEKLKPYSREYLLSIQKAIAPFFEICEIRE